MSFPDGVVKIESGVRGTRKVVVENTDTGDKKSYNVSIQKYLNVRDGDRIKAGEPLVDGLINPHDILTVLGAI